jgi:hypothetical protein
MSQGTDSRANFNDDLNFGYKTTTRQKVIDDADTRKIYMNMYKPKTNP